MADWKDEARGIPVWVGAAIGRVGHGYVGTAYQVGTVLVYVMCHKDAAGVRLDWRDEAYPDLSDPDTQAAYLRRLAIRLGCPEEVANAGVMFYAEPRSAYWTAAAGGLDDCGDWVWCRDVSPNVDDRLLALVRAWRVADDG